MNNLFQFVFYGAVMMSKKHFDIELMLDFTKKKKISCNVCKISFFHPLKTSLST
jgi:hypothetical protein